MSECLWDWYGTLNWLSTTNGKSDVVADLQSLSIIDSSLCAAFRRFCRKIRGPRRPAAEKSLALLLKEQNNEIGATTHTALTS